MASLEPPFRDAYGPLPVEVHHDRDVALPAPAGGVVDPHPRDAGIVRGLPGLGNRAPQHPPHGPVRDAQRRGHLDRRQPGEGHGKDLSLEEGSEVRVRPHLPGHPHGMDAVLRAVRPGHGAVDDRLVLPDVEVAPGALPGVVGAAAPPALRALHRLSLHVRHADVELAGSVPLLLEPDVRDLPFRPEPHRPLEEPCQHPGLRFHCRLPGGCPAFPCRAASYRSEEPAASLQRCATHQK